jgi:arylsulfatase A
MHTSGSRPHRLLTGLAAGLLVALGSLVGLAASKPPPPNIIFILADDLGHGDLGAYGQTKIATPNLDRLAAGGMRFTRHYSGNAVCAPSRCVLLTGRHPGHAWIRDNGEVQPEGQRPLPAGTPTLARLLQAHGYATGAFGKWGLGGPGSEGDPLRQGFDRFFGYNCQRQAHNYYPTNLWDNDRRLPLNNPAFSPHQKLPATADTALPNSYAAYRGTDYAPDLIAARALDFIRAQRDRPFFVYFPSTIPHLALQVPDEALTAYAGRWPETPYRGERSYLPHPTPRAAYAAMVSRLDRHVGDLMNLVAELGLEARTIFVFASDNGPLYDGLGGTDDAFFNSAGGLRGRKGSLYEGGVRVPGLVRWPGKVRAGTTSDRVTGFEDWLPTLLELAGLRAAAPRDVDGISFAPTLLGRQQKPRPWLYREFPGYGGQQAVWAGDWKAIRTGLNRAASVPSFQLYHLRRDPLERTDVAAANPRVLARLERLTAEQHVPSASFPLGVVDRR